MRRVVGSAIFFFSAIAPVLAQGPMSPVPLSKNAVAVTPEPAVRPPAPQAVAVTTSPAPVANHERATAPAPAAPVKKRAAKKAAPIDDTSAETADASASDKSPTAKGSAKRSGIDPDNMADLLNRMQLEGGYGASTTIRIRRLPPSAGE